MVTDEELEQAGKKAAASLLRYLEIMESLEDGETKVERRRRQEKQRRAEKKRARELTAEKSIGLGVLKCHGCRRPLRDHELGECRI